MIKDKKNCRGLIYQILVAICTIKNVGLMNQAPTDEKIILSPYTAALRSKTNLQ
jgi:hypothetical protein